MLLITAIIISSAILVCLAIFFFRKSKPSQLIQHKEIPKDKIKEAIESEIISPKYDANGKFIGYKLNKKK